LISGPPFYGGRKPEISHSKFALRWVYVAGGHRRQNPDKCKTALFFTLSRQGSFEAFLSNVPVSIVLNESAPLLGAAYEALAAIDK